MKRGLMRLRLLSLSLAVIAMPVLAHDFWLQPARFEVEPGAPLNAVFLVGHGAARDRWNNNDRIVSLNEYFGAGKIDRRGSLRTGGAADFAVRFESVGLHVLGMQSTYAASELPALRFNDYVKEEGLVLIAAARKRAGTLNAAGRERYSRRAKSMIQVGARGAGDQRLATRPIGLKLEIVLQRNPYALSASRTLPIHVLYNGRRLANATVKLTNLADDAKPVSVAVTDRSGRAEFRIPGKGNWLLNTVWGEPIAGVPDVDFDTTFSSLTFSSAGP